MASSLYQRLLQREVYGTNRNTNVRALYGDKKWVDDLDIVNELDGHTGCVNALSWSRNGKYLASGSDDHHLNIHAYNPDDSIKPFELATSIVTGHSANIFSVKFMPHTNDRTLVTVAGDSEVRIFDVEASSRSMINNLSGRTYEGVRYLSEGDTNAKVFRSHSDRVKRIVTESSPHLFLTCSEDGEVRQWDLRQPSSTYPRARGSRMVHRGATDDDSSVPPPLISYKKWRIDLNTISCSPTQPHYIALGGTHLHCFLHDRRMLGRDRIAERGGSIHSNGSSEHEDEILGEATRCVKKFAPKGQRKMKRNDSGHITACKISDASPNELIASWSGDWIYHFDILRDTDSSDRSSKALPTNGNSSKSVRVQSSKDRKRKRTKEGSTISHEGASRADPKSRTTSQEDEPENNVALHVRYQNGQSEAIPLRNEPETFEEPQLSEKQKQAAQIARTNLRIRKLIFDMKRAGSPSHDLIPLRPTFTSTLGFASSVLDDMASMMREWGYPMDPDPLDVAFQQTLRKTRESTWRFVQASGTLARLLGGKLQTGGGGGNARLSEAFETITGPPNESKIDDQSELFSYEFIKAIVLWLSSGSGALIEGFSRNTRLRQDSSRHPLPENASIEAIDENLIPYLLSLAGDRPIPRLGVSPFEIDAHRQIFGSEKEAVLSFAQAIKRPFEDLGQAVVPPHRGKSADDESPRALYRKEAIAEWGLVVARGVLCNASKALDYKAVNQAFGGVGPTPRDIRKEEKMLAARIVDILVEDDDSIVESVNLSDNTRQGATSTSGVIAEGATEYDPLIAGRQRSANVADDSDEEVIPLSDIRHAAAMVDDTTMQDSSSDDEGADGVDGNSDEESEEEDEDDDAAEDGDGAGARSFVYRSAMRDYGLRERVNLSVPCATHTRHYQGHCNVKTIKDVNFYGLNDEYVVSGSDSGHVFIWDRKTSRLLNILEGDGEVVNVIQGHPYEPMLAVSGIDHTIKIFSADARARRDAKRGIGIPRVDHSSFSSITFGRRMQRQRARRQQQQQDETDNQTNEQPAAQLEESSDDGDAPETTANGLKSAKRRHLEYQITSQNDEDRRGGSGSEAYITRSMLAQIAARMHFAYHNRGSGGNGEGGDGDDDDDGGGPAIGFEGPGGQTVIVDDCMIM